jgi:hypothetical protein
MDQMVGAKEQAVEIVEGMLQDGLVVRLAHPSPTLGVTDARSANG